MAGDSAFSEQYDRIRASRGAAEDSVRLHDLFDAAWEHALYERPERATSQGRDEYNDRWSDLSCDAWIRRRARPIRQLEVLGSIDRDKLGCVDQLSYDLFRRELEEDIEGDAFPHELVMVNQAEGPHTYIPAIMRITPVRTPGQRSDFLARLGAIPMLLAQYTALLDLGRKAGVTPPRVCLKGLPDQVLNNIVADPEDAAMLVALSDLPAGLSESEVRQFRQEAAGLYRDTVVPALQSFHDYLVDTYIPGCRQTTGWSELPGGSEWYEWEVRRHTTTDLSPKEVHEIGLAEVARIRGEMTEVMQNAGYSGDFQSFLEFLRTDPQFFFTSADDLLKEYRDIAKRVDPKLIELFGILPRLPYGVTPVPSYSERSATTAYYEPGSPEGGRPGYFYANTYDLSSRPKWEMEALTLHEAVPGHHLQIALAQELEGLPEFRKNTWITAYGEGWALYAESLGEEMGFYDNPYSRFGQLTYEMWRAIRLVVDPGMHALGWSRQQAIDFFRENSSKTQHDIEVEVDRYLVWPGQALAYKIGELRIKELRAYAERELGGRFDIRAFHDELLGAGYLPLDLLDTRMHEWVASRK